MTRSARNPAVPADFADYATIEAFDALRTRYACSTKTLQRWIAEEGIARPDLRSRHQPKQIPEDFRQQWESKSILTLAAHYKRNHKTISSWVAALGLYRPRGLNINRPQKVVEPKPQVAKAPVRKPVKAEKSEAFRLTHVQHFHRDTSAAGEAADTLRRDRWTVFRCNEKGRQDSAGKFWMCGRVLCTDAELIERGERAARRLAA